jgi:hypothetical protein
VRPRDGVLEVPWARPGKARSEVPGSQGTPPPARAR